MSPRYRAWTIGFDPHDPEGWGQDERNERAQAAARLMRELDLHELVERLDHIDAAEERRGGARR